MDEDTKQEILSRVDALAAKMGTTAEYLWASFIQDITVRGLVYVGVGTLLFVLASVLFMRGIKTFKSTEGFDHNLRCSAEGCGVSMCVVSIILAIVGLVVTLMFLSDFTAPSIEAWRILIGGK